MQSKNTTEMHELQQQESVSLIAHEYYALLLQCTCHSTDVINGNVLYRRLVHKSVCEDVEDDVSPVRAIANPAQVGQRLLGGARRVLSFRQFIGNTNKELSCHAHKKKIYVRVVYETRKLSIPQPHYYQESNTVHNITIYYRIPSADTEEK